MIKIETLSGDEYITVALPGAGGTIKIEIASTDLIEYGVLTFENTNLFESDKKYKSLCWHGPKKISSEFFVTYPESSFLIIWNSERSKNVIVAYRFSEE